MISGAIIATMLAVAVVGDVNPDVCGGVWASPINTLLLVALAVIQTTRHQHNKQELEQIKNVVEAEVSSQIPGGKRQNDPPVNGA